MNILQSNPAVLFLAATALAAAALALGWWLNNRLGQSSLEVARRRTEDLLRTSRREADKARRAALLRAREESFEQRNKVERDLRAKKGQLVKRERELNLQRQQQQDIEAEFDGRREDLRKTEANLVDKEKQLDEARLGLDGLVQEQNTRLEQVPPPG